MKWFVWRGNHHDYQLEPIIDYNACVTLVEAGNTITLVSEDGQFLWSVVKRDWFILINERNTRMEWTFRSCLEAIKRAEKEETGGK